MKEFEGIEFEADLVVFYGEIQTILAGSYEDFGPVNVSENSKPFKDMSESELKDFNDKIKLQKSEIKKGYDWAKEKIKALRQDYRSAVNAGTRSGSGRIVRDNWDDLTQIWAGSPATKAIDNNLTPREVNGENLIEVDEIEGNEILGISSAQAEQNCCPAEQSCSAQSSSGEQNPNKRSFPVNATPKFVDNKRKKL